jgi:hypothetical protein
MHASVRALLHQIIDYAGLFPPAKLPLEEALRIYLQAKKTSPHAWMLGRFVCPAARLGDLLALAKGHDDAALVHLTALGQPIATAEEFLSKIGADLRAIQDFRQSWVGDSVIDMVEIALPKGVAIDSLLVHLPHVEEALVQARVRGFFEIPMTPSWSNDVTKLCCTLRGNPKPTIGLKLRCGGLTKEAFPSHAHVASFISQCTQAGIPWKATAGLHHPRHTWDESLQLWHFGFINLFAAGVMAHTHALTEEVVSAIIWTGVMSQFHFEADRLTWKNWSATTAQIADARANFATSFGSCSFEEPCADLTAMGLLDPSEPEA